MALPVVAIGSAVALHLAGDHAEALVGWATLAFLIGLFWLLVWPVEYVLGADALVIRFGRLRSRISYRTIRGVTPSRSLLASPALSLDRVAVDTGGALAPTISPRDRDAFLDDLAARAPHLHREGDRLLMR